MITGSITKCSKSEAKAMRESMWCPECLEWQLQSVADESFDDQFGLVTDWGVSDECPECSTEMVNEEKYEDE